MKYTPDNTPWDKNKDRLKQVLVDAAAIITTLVMIWGLVNIFYDSQIDPDWQPPEEYVDGTTLANADEYYNLYCDGDPPVRIAVDKTSFEFTNTLGEHTCFLTKVERGVESAPSERLTFTVYSTHTEKTIMWNPEKNQENDQN